MYDLYLISDELPKLIYIRHYSYLEIAKHVISLTENNLLTKNNYKKTIELHILGTQLNFDELMKRKNRIK